jgi:hypothetical protein
MIPYHQYHSPPLSLSHTHSPTFCLSPQPTYSPFNRQALISPPRYLLLTLPPSPASLPQRVCTSTSLTSLLPLLHVIHSQLTTMYTYVYVPTYLPKVPPNRPPRPPPRAASPCHRQNLIPMFPSVLHDLKVAYAKQIKR